VINERCRHELITEQCGYCSPVRVTDAFSEPVESQGPWFRAAYPGECAECGETLDAGEFIRGIGGDRGEYIGECCGEPGP